MSSVYGEQVNLRIKQLFVLEDVEGMRGSKDLELGKRGKLKKGQRNSS